MTLTAFVQPPLLELFVPRDAPETMKTSVSTLGYGRFLALSSILVLLFCLLFFTLEAFTFFHWQQWTFNVVGTSLLTIVFLMALETIRR